MDNKDFAKIIKEFANIPLRTLRSDRSWSEYRKLPYKCIGTGFSRIVFDIGDGFVLKVADIEYGAVCNYNEYLLYNCFKMLRKYLCPTEWVNCFDAETPEQTRFLVMHNAYSVPFDSNSDYLDDETLFWLLGEIGLDTSELELGENSINGLFIDYGATPDGSAINLVDTVNYLKCRYSKL